MRYQTEMQWFVELWEIDPLEEYGCSDDVALFQ